jgi:opacity protein-like surface antigen
MRLKHVVVGVVLSGFVLVAPAAADADWIFTPFVGGNFGGDTVDTTVNFGGSLAYMGAGAVGFEVDFGYAPEFFGFDSDDIDSNVTTLMANVIVGAPIGGTSGPGVRPYVSGGAGLLRTHVKDAGDLFDISDNSFGFDVGGGAMIFLSDNVGIRGDIRYFRSLENEEDDDFDLPDLNLGEFDFWRGTVGVSFRF